MKATNNIEQKIESTINAFDSHEEVNVSPFFKDKTMQRLFSQSEEQALVKSWFTPNLQFAAIVCVVILNVLALSQLNTEINVVDLDEFATTMESSIDEDEADSMFNNW